MPFLFIFLIIRSSSNPLLPQFGFQFHYRKLSCFVPVGSSLNTFNPSFITKGSVFIEESLCFITFGTLFKHHDEPLFRPVIPFPLESVFSYFFSSLFLSVLIFSDETILTFRFSLFLSLILFSYFHPILFFYFFFISSYYYIYFCYY